MKAHISPRTYRAMYRLLDRVSPINGDCGKLCGAVCCTCTFEPDDFEYTAEGDMNADSYLGLYLMPGEEKIHGVAADDEGSENCGSNEWIDWGYIMAEDYEYPDSWDGRVYFIQCRTAPECPRHERPIQCRTFPLAPHIDENGIFHIIMNCDDLPYKCPLISEGIRLNDDFIKATYTVWKHLIRDPQIMDLVLLDSEIRIDENKNIKVMK